MNQRRYLVVSSDCHAGQPTEFYRPYLESKYLEAFDAFLKQRDQMQALRQSQKQENEEFVETWFGENEEGLTGGWEAGVRDRELDRDGVAAEVIFPDSDAVLGSTAAPFGAGLGLGGGGSDPELQLAGARAYNRWLAELCQDSPERRVGLALMPILSDQDAAVREIRSAFESGLRGLMIPAMWNDFAPYHDRVYDKVWDVAQELDMPLHTHTGVGPVAEYGPYFGIGTAEYAFWASRPLSFLLWSGVFDRFPRLKFVTTEAGCYWLADLLWRWDMVYDREFGAAKLSGITQYISKRPSAYVDSNFWAGASNTKERELLRRYEIGIDNIMWGSDFPHPEGSWPNTKKRLRESLWDIPVDETRRILGESALDNVYSHLDRSALRELADTIGPTPEELGQTDEVDLTKWDKLKAAGRPWITHQSPV
ncbi:MAG TPA: amidohydrolase family protein [Frankiaceae bacterium]|jgi:predicted TIM-barrel fold metal-dependent hydrolase|nr:amidohydrolase family protein [Frankiaceae bacterium]